MSLLVWVMMGIAVWHFTVFVPDRFWGGIVGAFLAAVVGGGAVRADRQRRHRPRPDDTHIVQALIAIPGALIGLASRTSTARASTASPASTTATRRDRLARRTSGRACVPSAPALEDGSDGSLRPRCGLRAL